MSTPLPSDEEFDARFRQGLERYPELPDDPAAWLGLELQLDALDRAVRLRRRVLRLLGGEGLVLGALGWALLHWVNLTVTPAGPATTGATTSGRPAAVAAAASRPAPGAAPAGRPLTATMPIAASPLPTANPGVKAPGEPALAKAVAADVPRAVAQPLNRYSAASPGRAALLSAGVAATRQTRHELALGAASAGREPERATRGRVEARRVGVGPAVVVTLRQPERQSVSAARRAEKSPVAASLSQGASPVARYGRRRQGQEAEQGPMSHPPLLAAGIPARQQPRAAKPAKQLTPAETAGAATPYRPASQATAPAATATLAAAATINQPRVAASSRALPVVAGEAEAARVDSLALRRGRLILPATELPAPLALLPEPSRLPVAPEHRPALQDYRLRVGLMASPELSTVNLKYVPAAGWSLGGYLDYRLTRRWHLSAGYLLTLKRYAAEGYDYHAPVDYYHPKWVIRDVDAVCRIVDLPLNLRYDLWPRPDRQAFVSVGLSSLLMRDERYTYYYDDVYGRPVAPTNWEFVNGSQHYFGVLNLSAGYERALGRRWAVQAEPFVKLPLAGVGAGSVRLASAGVFFSFRYGLLPQPTPPAP